MAVQFPQFDIGLSGANDAWDNDNAGIILVDDYFQAPSSPAQNVTLPLLTDTDTLFTPTVTRGAVTASLPTITDTDTLFVPVASPGAVGVTLPTVTSGFIYEPTIVAQQILTIPYISSTDTLFNPSILNASIPVVTPFKNIAVPYNPSDNLLYAPTVTLAEAEDQSLVLPFRSLENTLYPPTVINYKSVVLPYIQNINTISKPTLSYQAGITLPRIVSGSLTPPELQSIVNVLLPALSEEVMYAFEIVTGAVELLLPLIDDTEVHKITVNTQKRVYTGLSYIFE